MVDRVSDLDRHALITEPGKTAEKTATSPLNGAAIPLGAHRQNTGGKKGRSGRPPEAFKELCRAHVTRDETQRAVAEILKDKDHPAFIGALNWATNHGFGKAKEILEVQESSPPVQHVWMIGGRELVF